jgi:hypothetical protein
MEDKVRILNEEEKKTVKLGIVNRMSMELGRHCIMRMQEEKMTLVEILSTISMMSCVMVDTLAGSTGRDPRTLLNGYIETVKQYKVKGEREED